MSLLVALLLGIVQGVTEFIPVSSDGHLVLVPYLLGLPHPGLAFDVALHVGTTVAAIVYFRAELLAAARGVLGRGDDADAALYRRLVVPIVVGSVPVALVGFFAEDAVAVVFDSPLAAAAFLFVTAAVLTVGEYARDRRVARAEDTAAAARREADRTPVWAGSWVGSPASPGPAPGTLPLGEDPTDRHARSLAGVRVRDGLLIGLAQTTALLPGVSRSATTISTGVLVGLTREAATRFSFLLGLPALVGATALQLPKAVSAGFGAVEIIGGIAASFVAGYLAIRYLVALVSRDRLTVFARYCVVAGAIGLFAYQMMGPPSSV